MRVCPICDSSERTLLWSSPFKVPDGWPLPSVIDWYKCGDCSLLYGDGDFDQELLNKYYRNYYGYGINSEDVKERLNGIADAIWRDHPNARVVDFGGAGDDGRSIIVDRLHSFGHAEAYCINAGDDVPECDVMVVSHVLEHVYDMPDVMNKIVGALHPSGLLIVDGPDATGLLQHWQMPMLDFHTKHVIHLRMLDYLRLMDRYGFTLIDSLKYVDIRASQTAPCFRMTFTRLDTAVSSRDRVTSNIDGLLAKLHAIDYPVNVWGLGDISWHLLAQCPNLEVLEYIDNDPAYRGQKFGGKPVLEKPTNNAPIIIMAQGQRVKLINNIRMAGVKNDIIEI